MPTRELFRADIYIALNDEPEVNNRLQALATVLGPQNAHLALSGHHHNRYLVKNGHYVVVCTVQHRVSEVTKLVLQHGFHLQGSHVGEGVERRFVTLFQLAAKL